MAKEGPDPAAVIKRLPMFAEVVTAAKPATTKMSAGRGGCNQQAAG